MKTLGLVVVRGDALWSMKGMTRRARKNGRIPLAAVTDARVTPRKRSDFKRKPPGIAGKSKPISESNGKIGTPYHLKCKSCVRRRNRNGRGLPMKSKPPPDRRKFANAWEEIAYLYDKLLYWLYRRADPGKARPYADRLERLLSKADPGQDAIFGEECRSLAREAKKDYSGAIAHRENEIRLIRRLHKVSRGMPYEKAMLEDYSYDDLSDRLDLLATLYDSSGHLDKAIKTLKESKKLCDTHGVRFDGEDLLQEYLEEKRNAPEDTEAVPRRNSRRAPKSVRARS
jgi:hypothetical protein